MATPNGTMNVMDATFMATWCAATVAVPKVPIRSVAVLNSIASKIVVSPMGMPSRNNSANLVRSGRWNRRWMRYLRNAGVRWTTSSIARAPKTVTRNALSALE